MNSEYCVLKNEKLTDSIWEMKLNGDTTSVYASGQFIDIKIDGNFLRRPISVADYNTDEITIVYKVVGSGTKKLSELKSGCKLDCLVGLGNGFKIKNVKKPLVIGGGVGIPPLYNLTKKLISDSQNVSVILGFNSRDEMFYKEKFEQSGAKVIITTSDGSCGIRGFVTDAINFNYDYVYACGPIAMLKAINKVLKTNAQFSLEERMGCGFGACMGCSINTVSGPKRVCCDGPVFERSELLW